MKHKSIEVPFATKEEFCAFLEATGLTREKIKNMTGGDVLAACNKYQENLKKQ